MEDFPPSPPLHPPKLQCKETWGWNVHQKSHEVRIVGRDKQSALFHPNWSNGTAGVRGECVLNGGPAARFYWEIKISDRIFGTSMMFGVGTRRSRLHADSFVNMIGEDDQGWGLSHKGLLWHNNQWVYFTRPFPENKPTTIGLLFDAIQGTLTYYKDGACLGVAFTGLNLVKEKLYPFASSTAAKTEMALVNMSRDFFNLRDICRRSILTSLNEDLKKVRSLRLPLLLEKFLTNQGDAYGMNDTNQGDAYDMNDSEDDGFDEESPNQTDLFEQRSWSHFALDFFSTRNTSTKSTGQPSPQTSNPQDYGENDADPHQCNPSYSMSQL